ncbi:MAG: hypothetical protein R2877_04910 [Bdellovibrionota bacterium]
MPKRSDIKSILIIGSGPIVIGQACEFDYSGTQSLRALKEEGYRTILVNSNPATIMTDPEYSDSTYIEPITVESVRKIIEKEKPNAILPTMGGQTALNLAMNLDKAGILKEFNIELIGARVERSQAEDRDKFKEAMKKSVCVLKVAVNNLDDAKSHGTHWSSSDHPSIFYTWWIGCKFCVQPTGIRNPSAYRT